MQPIEAHTATLHSMYTPAHLLRMAKCTQKGKIRIWEWRKNFSGTEYHKNCNVTQLAQRMHYHKNTAQHTYTIYLISTAFMIHRVCVCMCVWYYYALSILENEHKNKWEPKRRRNQRHIKLRNKTKNYAHTVEELHKQCGKSLLFCCGVCSRWFFYYVI